MISVKIPFDSEQHRKMTEALRNRKTAALKVLDQRKKKWRQNEDLMCGYVKETTQDRLRRGQRENEGKPKYTTIVLPYTYAVSMTAYSYWSTVFLARSPIFQFQGSTGEGENSVMALEALANYQIIRGRMLPNLYIWLQDVTRYGEAWVSPYWKTVIQRTSEVVLQPRTFLGMEIPGAAPQKVRKVTEITGYQGNALYNVAPSCVLTDPRYARTRFQEGEFVGIELTVSLNELKADQTGRYFNLEKLAAKDGQSQTGFNWDSTNSDSESIGLQRPNVSDFGSNVSEEAGDVFKAYEFIINLIPNDWKLGTSTFPEKWVISITSDMTTIFECRPQGCLHDKFPLALIECEAEGYGLFSRGMPEIFDPIQNTLDWLVNSHFYNVRQALNNQWILDPSRVETRDLQNNGQPGLAIKLKPAAYGTDVRTALQQLPVADVTRSHFTDIQFMYDLGERLGVSDAMQGMSNPSSRRTAQEIRGDQAFSVSKLKTMAEYFSCTGWADLADMIVQNSQQYMEAPLKLKIVGELAQFAGPGFINVAPEDIVGQFNVVPVDGTMPIDRYAQANMWRETITQMAQVPQVLAQYDLGKIFGYMAQLGGIRNLDRFKVQVVPDQMALAQAGQGNLVPAQGDPMAMNMMEPGQVPGNGPTA